MIEVQESEIDGKKFHCIRVDLPTSPLVAVFGKKGYIMCGYLNLETAERLGQAAVIMTGVKSFGDILDGNVSAMTNQAKKLGVKEGISGREAIKMIC